MLGAAKLRFKLDCRLAGFEDSGCDSKHLELRSGKPWHLSEHLCSSDLLASHHQVVVTKSYAGFYFRQVNFRVCKISMKEVVLQRQLCVELAAERRAVQKPAWKIWTERVGLWRL